jgi:hypothetical protein
MEEDKLQKKIDERVKELLPQYMKSGAFTDRKLTDTPTDSFAVVNRQYVTLNGTSANRPTSSIVGQFYFDQTLHKPVWWDGTSFRDAAGNVV